MWLAGASAPLPPGWTDGPVQTESSAGLRPSVSGVGRSLGPNSEDSRPRPACRRTASPAAAPGPFQGSSAQHRASRRFRGLVDVSKAKPRPWPRLETGPTQDWMSPLCAQQPGLVLIPRRSLDAGVLPMPPGSPSRPGSVTKARKATLLRSRPSPADAPGRVHRPGAQVELVTSACPDFPPDPAPPRSAPSRVGRLLPPGGQPSLPRRSAWPALLLGVRAACFLPTLHSTLNKCCHSHPVFSPSPVCTQGSYQDRDPYPFYCTKIAQVSKPHFIQLDQQTTHLKQNLENKNHKLDQENVISSKCGFISKL